MKEAVLWLLLTAIHAAEISSYKLTPEETQRFRAVVEYSRAPQGGSVLAMRRGEIVFEDYAPGWRDKPLELASGTTDGKRILAVQPPANR